jgi:hypothetical protein
MDRCPTCKFYVPFKNANPQSKLTGYCHRYPRLPTDNNYLMSEVTKDDWCGEWRANLDYIQNQSEDRQ